MLCIYIAYRISINDFIFKHVLMTVNVDDNSIKILDIDDLHHCKELIDTLANLDSTLVSALSVGTAAKAVFDFFSSYIST
jgi:hypothetical protein